MAIVVALAGLTSVSVAQQVTFSSPEAAAQALIAAARASGAAELVGIFGKESEDLITTADPAQDAQRRSEFLRVATEKLAFERDGDTVTLVLGNLDWPFPVPLVKEGEVWRFDTAAGAEEILHRRIGENELATIAACRAYIDAQEVYRALDCDEDGVREYAQKLASTPGKSDGLYWEAGEGDEESPFGPMLAEAGEYGALREAGAPWYGYRYKILLQQGWNAPGGIHSYVINGNMVAGCALAAWPADYGDTGIMSFMISHHGTMYQKDLGPGTEWAMSLMSSFNPDSSWKVVPEEEIEVAEEIAAEK